MMMRGILRGFSWMVCLLLLVVAQPTPPLSFLFTGYRVASSRPSSPRQQQPGNLFLFFFASIFPSSGQASLASLVATPTGVFLVSLLSKTLQPAVGLMDRRIHTQRQAGGRAYMRCGWFFSSSHFPSPFFLSLIIITAHGHVWDRTHLRYHGAAKAVGLGWVGWLSPFLFFHSPF